MRFSTSFIEFIRANLYAPGSSGDTILAKIVEHRKSNDLDTKFEAAGDPWKAPDNVLEYEINKLGTVFEAIRSFDACGDESDIVDVLKERYPAAEVDDLIIEYFPHLRHLTAVSPSGPAHL